MIVKLAIKPVLTFKTAKGSQYWVDENGRSQRYKHDHPNYAVSNPGWKEPFNHVIYVKNSDAHHIDLAADHRSNWWMIICQGKVGILSFHSDNKMQLLSGPFDCSFNPQIGLAPIEIEKLTYAPNIQGFYVQGGFHIGNEIVALKYLD